MLLIDMIHIRVIYAKFILSFLYTRSCGLWNALKKILGVTSKLNRRLTAQNRRFRAVAIVQNNSNRPDPLVTSGQPPVEF